MGASQQKTEQSHHLPECANKIIQVLNPQLQSKIQPFTDYIIFPSKQAMKVAEQILQITIFSILDYSIRKETLPITNQHIGVKIKECKVKDCILRITKVFPNSPIEKLGITFDEYIVGLAEAEYDNLQGFAEIMKTLITKRKQVITMAICNQHGRTRIVPIPLALLDEWRLHNKGILGCELAEGWMNRFKAKLKKKQSDETRPAEGQTTMTLQSQIKKESKEEKIKQQILQNMNELKKQEESSSEESEQVQRKTRQLMGVQDNVIEVNFKGLLKNQYLDDASTICKCKIYNKNCENCFLQKQNNYFFFNKKTNRIISIPANLLFKVQE